MAASPRTSHRIPLRRTSLPLALIALLVAFVGLLAARGRAGGQTLPAEGGTLREETQGPVERVNPLLASTPAERDLAELVFAGLTRPGPSGEALPDLAEDWQGSADGRVFVFRLRRDLLWQDGEPLTVQDAIFTISLIQQGAGNDPRLAEVWRGARLSPEDERHLRVELSAPFAALPAYAMFGLLPEHLLRDVAPASLGNVSFNKRPVGSGPFRLLTFTDDRAHLARYDAYHLGAPYLDAIDLTFGDPDAAADAVVAQPGVSVGGRVTHDLTRPAYVAVMLNNDAPLFAADTVRRALSLAVDRRALVARTRGGLGAPTDVPFAPGNWAHDGVDAAPLNLDLARSLLASAGWEAGTDGVLRRGSRELRFTLVVADDPGWIALARVVADGWAQVGARVIVAPARAEALVKEFLDPRAYEAALVGWDPGPDPDPYSGWHSSLRGKPGGNPANFADEQSDRLLAEGRIIPDLDERQTRYAAFQARFRELAPSIILYAETVRYAVRDGVQLSLPQSVPDAAGRFSDVRRWALHSRRLR